MSEEYGPTLRVSDEVHSQKYRTTGETFTQAMTRLVEEVDE